MPNFEFGSPGILLNAWLNARPVFLNNAAKVHSRGRFAQRTHRCVKQDTLAKQGGQAVSFRLTGGTLNRTDSSQVQRRCAASATGVTGRVRGELTSLLTDRRQPEMT